MKIILAIFVSIFLLTPAPKSLYAQNQDEPITTHFPGYWPESRGEKVVGERYTFVCIGKNQDPDLPGYIEGSNRYGTDIYTGDTGVCVAAVHMGYIKFEKAEQS